MLSMENTWRSFPTKHHHRLSHRTPEGTQVWLTPLGTASLFGWFCRVPVKGNRQADCTNDRQTWRSGCCLWKPLRWMCHCLTFDQTMEKPQVWWLAQMQLAFTPGWKTFGMIRLAMFILQIKSIANLHWIEETLYPTSWSSVLQTDVL